MRHEPDVFGLQGKVALVTGGGSGIGRATAELLASFGVRVAILDVVTETGNAAVESIHKQGGEAQYIHCDVTNERDCQAAVRQANESFGQIDILFNNAGVIRRQTVVESSVADWDLVVNVSLKGAYLLSKHVIPVMAAGGGGSVVNTGSGWGLKGGHSAAAYCAAKAGVVNLTRAMAIDHGPQGIRVNCVAPGDTDTPLLRAEARQLGADETGFLETSGRDRPLGRIGRPTDIANAVLFLVSDLAAWITGSVLVVDGGGLA